MASVYSVRFIVQRGLNGTGAVVTVPAGHTYVVKQLSAYAASTATTVEVYFRDNASSTTLWRHEVPGGTANWGGDYGARVFEAGDSMVFVVDAAPIDAADVFASGYDLIA